MKRYFVSRILYSVLTLLAVITVTFFLFRILPGDPTTILVAEDVVPKHVIEELLERYGLDKPLHEQYILYIKNLCIGNFGWSFYYRRPVMTIISQKIVNTLILSLSSFILAYSVSIIGGVILAFKRGTFLEKAGSTIVLVFRCAPNFWLGMIAIMAFSISLNIFPQAGLRTPGYIANNFFEKYFSLDFLYHLALPTIVTAAGLIGFPMLLLKNSMLEVMHQDFVELLKAKGLKDSSIRYRHVLRNALLPLVTAAAIYIGMSMGGQVITETLFSWPGVGREIVKAISNRDYPLAQGLFFLISLVVILMNFVADILYGILDPRVTYD